MARGREIFCGGRSMRRDGNVHMYVDRDWGTSGYDDRDKRTSGWKVRRGG